MQLQDSKKNIDEITTFLTNVFELQQKTQAVIAISGGIDSAISLSLLARAVPKKDIHCILLPYGEQSVADSETICHWNDIPQDNWHEINIKPMVDVFAAELGLAVNETYRLGNLMARARMMVVYDFAKKLDALVVGTENKTEKFLGYFTRFGDEASDIEPIQHLYKTQIRQLAQELSLPSIFLEKPPSAGLWGGQTDEIELGFTYTDADKVLEAFIDNGVAANQIVIDGVDPYVVQRVIERVKSQFFKHEVPYAIINH